MQEEEEETKEPLDNNSKKSFMINTLESDAAAEEFRKSQQQPAILQFRPYDDLLQAKNQGKLRTALSPKLIPYKHNSFSSSERSSDLEAFYAKNQEASQGQGHMQQQQQRPS